MTPKGEMEAIVTAERRPDRRITMFLALLARESGDRLTVEASLRLASSPRDGTFP